MTRNERCDTEPEDPRIGRKRSNARARKVGKEGLRQTYEYFKALPPEEWKKQPKEFVRKKNKTA